MIKRFLPSNIFQEKRAGSASVVATSYAFEWLLTSRVPDLQFYVFVINFNRTTAKLDSDCQIVLLPEALVCELKQQTWFSDTYMNNSK